jgi:hypothetical protein
MKNSDTIHIRVVVVIVQYNGETGKLHFDDENVRFSLFQQA